MIYSRQCEKKIGGGSEDVAGRRAFAIRLFVLVWII